MNNTGNVLLLLPARGRQIAYILFGLVALASAAAGQGYAAIDLSTPPWLEVTLSVVGFLAIPFSAVAASNVSKDAPARVIESDMSNEPPEPERAWSDQPDHA